jgi:hypothetical protein
MAAQSSNAASEAFVTPPAADLREAMVRLDAACREAILDLGFSPSGIEGLLAAKAEPEEG